MKRFPTVPTAVDTVPQGVPSVDQQQVCTQIMKSSTREYSQANRVSVVLARRTHVQPHPSKRMSSSSVASTFEASPKFPTTAPGSGSRLPYRSTCSTAGSDLFSDRPLTQKACSVPGGSPRTVVVVTLPTVICGDFTPSPEKGGRSAHGQVVH